MGLVAGMPRPGSSEESMPLTVAETGRFGRDPERGGAGGETTCDETRSRSKVPFAAVCVGALVVVFVVAFVTGGVGSSGVDFAVRASRVEVRHTVTNVGGHRGEAPSGGHSAGEARLGHVVMMASDADSKRDEDSNEDSKRDRKRDDNDQSDTSSSATVPKLGQERYCGDAFSTPNNVGPLDATRISVTAQGVLKYADAVYVICTDMCETLIIPQELAEKTTLVNGYTLDACAGLGDETKHWEKASRAHSAAMIDAFANEDINILAILEQDTLGDQEVVWAQGDWYGLEGLLKRTDWSLLRMSYRPFNFEEGREFSAENTESGCPEKCQCDKYGDTMCKMREKGCAMQSSDAYFVNRDAMELMVPLLGEGKVIDFHVFRDLPNQVFLIPAVAAQTSYSYAPDVISMEDGKKSVSTFMEKCTRDAVWEE